MSSVSEYSVLVSGRNVLVSLVKWALLDAVDGTEESAVDMV